MWDDFKCMKSTPEVPCVIISARAIERPPTVHMMELRGLELEWVYDFLEAGEYKYVYMYNTV